MKTIYQFINDNDPYIATVSDVDLSDTGKSNSYSIIHAYLAVDEFNDDKHYVYVKFVYLINLTLSKEDEELMYESMIKFLKDDFDNIKYIMNNDSDTLLMLCDVLSPYTLLPTKLKIK